MTVVSVSVHQDLLTNTTQVSVVLLTLCRALDNWLHGLGSEQTVTHSQGGCRGETLGAVCAGTAGCWLCQPRTNH